MEFFLEISFHTCYWLWWAACFIITKVLSYNFFIFFFFSSETSLFPCKPMNYPTSGYRKYFLPQIFPLCLFSYVPFSFKLPGGIFEFLCEEARTSLTYNGVPLLPWWSVIAFCMTSYSIQVKMTESQCSVHMHTTLVRPQKQKLGSVCKADQQHSWSLGDLLHLDTSKFGQSMKLWDVRSSVWEPLKE